MSWIRSRRRSIRRSPAPYIVDGRMFRTVDKLHGNGLASEIKVSVAGSRKDAVTDSDDIPVEAVSTSRLYIRINKRNLSYDRQG